MSFSFEPLLFIVASNIPSEGLETFVWIAFFETVIISHIFSQTRVVFNVALIVVEENPLIWQRFDTHHKAVPPDLIPYKVVTGHAILVELFETIYMAFEFGCAELLLEPPHNLSALKPSLRNTSFLLL